MKHYLAILILVCTVATTVAQDYTVIGKWNITEKGEEGSMTMHRGGKLDIDAPEMKTEDGVLMMGGQKMLLTYKVKQNKRRFEFDMISSTEAGEVIFTRKGLIIFDRKNVARLCFGNSGTNSRPEDPDEDSCVLMKRIKKSRG